jgi:hypothetical protein
MNKKKALIMVLIAGAVLYWLTGGQSEEEWMPSSTAKRAKVKKQDYSELKKQALLAISDSTAVPVLPKDILDPFKSHENAKSGGGIVKSVKRNYSLKGIMLQEPLLAVILDETGVSHVVSVGEKFNGVAVVAVGKDQVFLKDSYGTFTLKQE